jgi:hypothetical protein
MVEAKLKALARTYKQAFLEFLKERAMTDKCLPDLEAWKRQQYVEMEAEHRFVSAKLDYDAARLIAWEEARPSGVVKRGHRRSSNRVYKRTKLKVVVH